MDNSKRFSEFLRLLAHDLQNQIGAVDLNLQIMPSLVDETDATFKAFEPFITRASNSAGEMIETLSDLQAYAYELAGDEDGIARVHQIEPVDLVRKVKDCALAVSSRARFRQVSLVADDAAEVTAAADGEALARALKLIVSDGLRGSFPGSKVELRAGVSDVPPRPFIEIRASTEGLFEADRQTLALFLAFEALKPSRVETEFSQEQSSSLLRLIFPAASPRS